MCKHTDNSDRFSSMFSPNLKATLEKHSIGLPSSYHPPKQYSDASTVTDLCSSDVAEVEIFSLIEEQIPKYKVRADKITNFSGTSNQDFEFVQFPALHIPENIGLGLTSDQIRETLNYFFLSGKRCSEMTVCYDDIEAVTRLLQEKEKDLELTVHIGQDLLQQNIQHEKRILELETELKNANENIAQLNHELQQKTVLINILTDNEEALNENAGSPTKGNMSFDVLQRKINALETENKKLHSEVAEVVKETDEIEEKERKLLADIHEQLNSTNIEYESLTFELERYKEENRLQNDQINNLTQRLAETELRLHQLLSENEEVYSTLNVTKENQNLLANELIEVKCRYEETLAMLRETQALLKEKQRKSQPQSNRNSLFIPGVGTGYNPESLRSEMESSMFSENSLDSGINSDNEGKQKNVPQFQKVFDTVKCASTNSLKNGIGDSLASELNLLSSSSQPRMASSIYSSDSINKPASSDKMGFSMYSSIYGSSKCGDDNASTESSEDYNSHLRYGHMGVPGARDLETALKNLSSAEILTRRAKLSFDNGSFNYDANEAHTPESIFSNNSASTGSSLSHYRYPKKLEIVKPIEGSFTLNQWKGLATPTFGSLLHDNERVKVRGEKGLDEFGLQTYSLGDVEEDAEEFLPGKHFQTSGCIYTYTDSKILHPDDGASITFSLPPSQMSSRMQSTCTSRQPTAPPTPRSGLSRRNSCSTFSMSTGLASMLNERGIQAITLSCLNTPTGQNFSPTSTPCNSPEGSPTHHRHHESVSLTSFLSSSAGLIKKITGSSTATQSTSNQSTENEKAILEKKAKLRSIKLLEKVEGIEQILPSSSSTSNQIINKPLALHSSNIYTRYHHSPMTQLTSLKHLSSSAKSTTGSESSDLRSESSFSPTNSQRRETQDARAKQKLTRQKTRRHLNAQRPDLGTVKSAVAVEKESKQQQQQHGLIGTISSIFFGRKGGFL